jgi:hypothetical protein
MANEVMKKEKPTMTTTVFGRSVRNATPHAALTALCPLWKNGERICGPW